MPDLKTVNLLLGNSEGRVSNLIEALVRDVCDNRAVVHCTRATGLDEFNRQVSEEKFDLVILIPEKLLPTPNCRNCRGCYAGAADAIRAIKGQGPTPTLAVAVPPQHQAVLSEAGADCVLDLPFKCEQVKSSVRQLLHLALSSVEEPAAEDPSEAPQPQGRGFLSWFQGLVGNN